MSETREFPCFGAAELAERCTVGLATIKRIEAAGDELAGTAKTLFRIQKALDRISSIRQPSPG